MSTAQRARSSPLPLNEVNIAGCTVPLSDGIKILGVTIDRHLTYNTRVQNISKSVNYHIRALKHIRSSLTTDIAKTVVCALVNSLLNCANSVLYGTSEIGLNIAKLQRLQNALARVVTYTKRIERIHPVLETLHWLPINYRIDYKVATLAYKIRSSGSPVYLLPAVSDYTNAIQLRSSTRLLLSKPPVKTETARRAFSQDAPSVWNTLPNSTTTADTFARFRTSIHIHTQHYWLIFEL